MHSKIRFRILLPIALFCICLLTSCPHIRDEPYVLPNPILAAYTHNIDLRPLRSAMEDSLFQIQEVDDGIILPAIIFMHSFRLWINDSVLVVRLESMPFLPIPRNKHIGGRVILESEFRKTYPDLADHMKPLLCQSLDRIKQRYTTHYKDQVSLSDRPLQINNHLLYPVKTLTWHSSAFGSEDIYHFRDGIAHGPFTSVDTTGLEQAGFFRNGVESGTWEYRDSVGQLQYIEQYTDQGELKKVTHQKGATFTRATPLPTLQRLKRMHYTMSFILGITIMHFMYHYVKTFRDIKIPYDGQSALEEIGGILLSFVLSFFAGVAVFLLTPMISHMLGLAFGWDVPVDLDILLPITFFVIAECIMLLLTNRLRDVLWHISIMVLITLLYYEWKFLLRLENF